MLAIHFYNIVNLLLSPLYIILIVVRVIKQKDNTTSFWQRLGFANRARPQGKLIWLHAASVGESMAAITLIKTLSEKYPSYHFLITTGTIASADIIIKSLPHKVIHQFTPIDQLLIVRSFLTHWRPDFGIFIESELWPCLINEASKTTNLALVNARLSDRSYKRWQGKEWLFKTITDKFKAVMVQSDTDLHKYQQLGCDKAINLGNLKFANKELDVDNIKLNLLKSLFTDKKVFVASSTHREDEDVALQVICNLKKENTNYYPVIVLRHPERRDELAQRCQKLGLKYSIRSSSNLPSLSDDLYIVDTFGELGLFYSLAFIVFVGGSFKRGGHNLVEPAYFDNVILLGPDMSNYQNIADDMIKKEAAMQIQTAEELLKTVSFFCDQINNEKAVTYRQNALKFVSNRKEIIDNYLKEIEKFIE